MVLAEAAMLHEAALFGDAPQDEAALLAEVARIGEMVLDATASMGNALVWECFRRSRLALGAACVRRPLTNDRGWFGRYFGQIGFFRRLGVRRFRRPITIF